MSRSLPERKISIKGWEHRSDFDNKTKINFEDALLIDVRMLDFLPESVLMEVVIRLGGMCLLQPTQTFMHRIKNYLDGGVFSEDKAREEHPSIQSIIGRLNSHIFTLLIKENFK